MDVRNSLSLSSSNYSEEKINVILNKVIATESKEEIAYSIIQKVLDNDFHTIKFSFRKELNLPASGSAASRAWGTGTGGYHSWGAA